MCFGLDQAPNAFEAASILALKRYAGCIVAMENSLVPEIHSSLASVAGKRISKIKLSYEEPGMRTNVNGVVGCQAQLSEHVNCIAARCKASEV